MVEFRKKCKNCVYFSCDNKCKHSDAILGRVENCLPDFGACINYFEKLKTAKGDKNESSQHPMGY